MQKNNANHRPQSNTGTTTVGAAISRPQTNRQRHVQDPISDIRPLTSVTGITLIALIVTIIVLIILASVSLNVLLGQNGIIGKATEAAQQTRIASAKEQIEMDILAVQIDTYGTTTLQDLKDKGIIDEMTDGIGIVNEDGYVFTVEPKEDGGFEVTYVGKEGEITIVGSHSINPETLTSKVEITVKGTYLGSGIKEIERPDGSKELGGASTKILETTYEVTANGEYIFKIIGNDNKTLDYKVTISNIDTEYPSGSHTLNPAEGTWGTEVEITVTGTDNQGIQSIEKPDGSVVTTSSTIYIVSENGEYLFKIKDTNGNVTSYTVHVANIDKEGPTANHTLNPNPPETGSLVEITVNASDAKSGVKEIVTPNSDTVTGIIATYTVTANGEYTFTLKDNLDNSIEYTVIVDNVQTLPAGWDDTKVEEEIKEGNLSAPVPKGYVASDVAGEDTITGGLVIYEGTTQVNSSNHATALTDRNQYVWIPVSNVNDMIMCRTHGASKLLTFDGSIFTCSAGEANPDLAGKLYGTIINQANNFNSSLTGQTYNQYGLREPDLLPMVDWNLATYYLTALGLSNFESLQTQMENDLKDLAVSVAKYEGFYCGRYETSFNGGTAESKKGKTVMDSTAGSGNMWYGMYAKQRKITSIVKTNMIWGCSYDQAMKFVNGKQDGMGNIYNVNTGVSARHILAVQVSGNNLNDKVANIYDLEGNLLEFSQEACYLANGTHNRVVRRILY